MLFTDFCHSDPTTKWDKLVEEEEEEDVVYCLGIMLLNNSYSILAWYAVRWCTSFRKEPFRGLNKISL